MAAHPGKALLVASVAELGFRKRAGMVFTLGDGERVGWLGLNVASRAGAVGDLLVNPVVGVRCRAVEAWVARGRGEKVHAYNPPTVSEPVRYLLHGDGRRDWILDGSLADHEVVESLVTGLATAGMEFIVQMSDVTALAERLGRHSARDQQAAYRWPIALILAGRRDDALSAVAQVRAALGAREDVAAVELRRFLERLQVEVTTGG